jgi:hypothetical protein
LVLTVIEEFEPAAIGDVTDSTDTPSGALDAGGVGLRTGSV